MGVHFCYANGGRRIRKKSVGPLASRVARLGCRPQSQTVGLRKRSLEDLAGRIDDQAQLPVAMEESYTKAACIIVDASFPDAREPSRAHRFQHARRIEPEIGGDQSCLESDMSVSKHDLAHW